MLAVILPSLEESRIFRIQMKDERYAVIDRCRFIVGDVGEPIALALVPRGIDRDILLDAFRQMSISRVIGLTYCKAQNPTEAGSLAIARGIRDSDGVLYRTTEELSAELLAVSQRIVQEVEWGKTFAPTVRPALLYHSRPPEGGSSEGGLVSLELLDSPKPFSTEVVQVGLDSAVLSVVTLDGAPYDGRGRIGTALAAAAVVSMAQGTCQAYVANAGV